MQFIFSVARMWIMRKKCCWQEDNWNLWGAVLAEFQKRRQRLTLGKFTIGLFDHSCHCNDYCLKGSITWKVTVTKGSHGHMDGRSLLTRQGPGAQRFQQLRIAPQNSVMQRIWMICTFLSCFAFVMFILTPCLTMLLGYFWKRNWSSCIYCIFYKW